MAIVLLTDFGASSPYAGIMKGVIHKIAPEESILDLSHSIASYDILDGALCLYQSHTFFPVGSIFVAVVDPGVGTQRKAILARTQSYYFIAPDNGLLTLVLKEASELSLFHLNRPEYHLTKVSQTFHARDIFSPVAAHLSQGVDLLSLGSPIHDYEKKMECFPQIKPGKIMGQILSIDPFGNAISNITQEQCKQAFPQRNFSLKLSGRRRPPLELLVSHYGQAPAGEACMLFGSSGFLEIAQHQGNLAASWKIRRGQPILLQQV